eukprot:361082-Chlamydomonas_euryale.AAC.5
MGSKREDGRPLHARAPGGSAAWLSRAHGHSVRVRHSTVEPSYRPRRSQCGGSQLAPRTPPPPAPAQASTSCDRQARACVLYKAAMAVRVCLVSARAGKETRAVAPSCYPCRQSGQRRMGAPGFY